MCVCVCDDRRRRWRCPAATESNRREIFPPITNQFQLGNCSAVCLFFLCADQIPIESFNISLDFHFAAVAGFDYYFGFFVFVYFASHRPIDLADINPN